MFISTFNGEVARWGTPVIIKSRTPRLDDDEEVVLDAERQIVYDIFEYDTKCLFRFVRKAEREPVGDVVIQNEVYRAKFSISDKDYLVMGNRVEYEDNGVSFDFEIKELVPRRSHIEVLLVD